MLWTTFIQHLPRVGYYKFFCEMKYLSYLRGMSPNLTLSTSLFFFFNRTQISVQLSTLLRLYPIYIPALNVLWKFWHLIYYIYSLVFAVLFKWTKVLMALFYTICVLQWFIQNGMVWCDHYVCYVTGFYFNYQDSNFKLKLII